MRQNCLMYMGLEDYRLVDVDVSGALKKDLSSFAAKLSVSLMWGDDAVVVGDRTVVLSALQNLQGRLDVFKAIMEVYHGR